MIGFPTIQQLDEILKVLVAYGKVDLEFLAVKLQVEPQTLRRFIDQINNEIPDLIRLEKNEANPYSSIRIPKEFMEEAARFLNDGGWSKFYDEKFEKHRLQQEREEREKQLSLENIEATTKAAKHAVTDAALARKQSKYANGIAIVSLTFTILFFLLDKCN